MQCILYNIVDTLGHYRGVLNREVLYLSSSYNRGYTIILVLISNTTTGYI